MSIYQDKLDNVKAEDEACFDHIVKEVNKALDIIQYTGNFEFDNGLSVGTLLVDLDSKIVSNTWYRHESGSDKKVPFWPMGILKRIPRATKINGGSSFLYGEYYASILHGDPEEWPELDYIPKIPEPPKPWWKFSWLW